MRTTLTIDEDLARILKQRARDLDKPFKQIVNTALRRGLQDELSEKPTTLVTVRPHDFGAIRPGIDTGRFNQLVDELDTDEFLRKAAQS